MLPAAPPVLPLKRPCSLSRTETNPQFGVYMIDSYRLVDHSSHLAHENTACQMIGVSSIESSRANFHANSIYIADPLL